MSTKHIRLAHASASTQQLHSHLSWPYLAYKFASECETMFYFQHRECHRDGCSSEAKSQSLPFFPDFFLRRPRIFTAIGCYNSKFVSIERGQGEAF